MGYGELYKLFIDGLGYLADNHIYKFKDYSEAIFESQIDSKEWLCQELKNVVVMDIKHISILAGWYGLVSIPILYKHFGEINIDLYDVDEYTTDIGRYMFRDYPKVNIYTNDVVFDDIEYKGQVIINTSCEHMFPMYKFRDLNRGFLDNPIYVLQSTDDDQYDDHINCVSSPDELAEQANFVDVLYSGTKVLDNGMNRFMVIGK